MTSRSRQFSLIFTFMGTVRGLLPEKISRPSGGLATAWPVGVRLLTDRHARVAPALPAGQWNYAPGAVKPTDGISAPSPAEMAFSIASASRSILAMAASMSSSVMTDCRTLIGASNPFSAARWAMMRRQRSTAR